MTLTATENGNGTAKGRRTRTGLTAVECVLQFVVKNSTTHLISWHVYRWSDAPSRVSGNSMPNADDIDTH